jgi:thioredoxin reductase (NADPH)
MVLADQRMPGMSGVEFIEMANQIFPNLKKALLTAYADTEAAIRAINCAHLDHYFVKPWDPPEERLYPPIDELLDEWFSSYEAPADVRIFGHRWSPECHALREFLSKNQVPYAWIDVERKLNDPEVDKIVSSATTRMPVVKLSDGTIIDFATPDQLADKIGLKSRAEKPFYDLAIVGAGPAGLAAAVYGASEGLQTVVVEREAPGGQAGASSLIENYLGFPKGLSGADLARRARDQAIRFNVEMLRGEATGIRERDGYKIVELKSGEALACRTVVLAMGVSYRRLDVPGAERLFNKGVYYGAALVEAVNCAGEHVVVVGGANSAGQAAMHFSKYATKVSLVVRGGSLLAAMSDYLVERIEATSNIEVRLKANVAEFIGTDRLTQVLLREQDQTVALEADAVFVMIGAEPHTGWLPSEIARDDNGFLLAGPEMLEHPVGASQWTKSRPPMLLESSMPGVFVAGDVRSGSVKRVASSVGQGSVAVSLIHEYLRLVEA